MKKRCATLVLVLLASCSETQQTPLIAKLQESDLYEKGKHCEGPYYRIDDNLILFDGQERKVVARNITLSEKGNTVTTTERRFGGVRLNLTFSFSPDARIATASAIYLDPEPSEQEWQQINAKSANAKARFQAYRDALKGLPQMEVCPRADAS